MRPERWDGEIEILCGGLLPLGAGVGCVRIRIAEAGSVGGGRTRRKRARRGGVKLRMRPALVRILKPAKARLLFITAVTGTLAACGPSEHGVTDAQAGDPIIAIAEGPCEATCPVYEMTLHPAGDYILHGERFVKTTGVVHGELGEAAWTQAEHALEQANFWKMKPEQTARTLETCQPGAPTVKVTWRTEEGREKTVTYNAGCGVQASQQMIADLRAAFDFDHLVWTDRKFDYASPPVQ